MAKKRFFFGRLAMVLALVFGLVLAGCSTDSDDDGGGGGGGPSAVDLPAALKNTTFTASNYPYGTITMVFAEKTVTVSASGGSSSFPWAGEHTAVKVEERRTGSTFVYFDNEENGGAVNYSGTLSTSTVTTIYCGPPGSIPSFQLSKQQ